MINKIIHLRKLGKIGRKNGGSYYITLPLEEIRALKWRKGQLLFIELHEDDLVIRKADYRRSQKK